MGIDLRENGNGYYDLQRHIGHKIVIVGYGCREGLTMGTTIPVNVAIECETCGEVLVDFNEPELPAPPEIEPEEKGNREVPENDMLDDGWRN